MRFQRFCLGREERGTPSYANIPPQTQKRKNGEIWPSKLNLFIVVVVVALEFLFVGLCGGR